MTSAVGCLDNGAGDLQAADMQGEGLIRREGDPGGSGEQLFFRVEGNGQLVV